MPRAGVLEISKKGRVRLPKAVRRRWGLRTGSEVAFLDLGDGLVIMPISADGVPDESADPTPDAKQSPASAGPGMSRPWSPDPDGRIGFSVAGEDWEVRWGSHNESGSAAYWIDQTISGGYADDGAFEAMDLKTAAVWGLLHVRMEADLANAYVDELMALLKKTEPPSARAVAEVLAKPIEGFGRYRYYNRKAVLISEAVTRLTSDPPPDDIDALRGYLLQLRGVGPTTAWLIESGFRGLHGVHVNASKRLEALGRGPYAVVDVYDIHLRRALLLSGVFRDNWNYEQHYDCFETAFLQYARHGNVSPGALDWCIWELARDAGSEAFGQNG